MTVHIWEIKLFNTWDLRSDYGMGKCSLFFCWHVLVLRRLHQCLLSLLIEVYGLCSIHISDGTYYKWPHEGWWNICHYSHSSIVCTYMHVRHSSNAQFQLFSFSRSRHSFSSSPKSWWFKVICGHHLRNSCLKGSDLNGDCWVEGRLGGSVLRVLHNLNTPNDGMKASGWAAHILYIL